MTDAYLDQKPFSEIETIILELCERQKLSDEDKKLMSEQIIGALLVDETIEYIVEEIKLKEEFTPSNPENENTEGGKEKK